jgi:hypothetical protein
MAPRVTDQIDAIPSPIPPGSRLRLDPSLKRLGVLDGGWWPGSRDATVELPGLVAALNERLGVIVRLGVDARDWDEVPRRITVDGRLVRVGRFADVDHKIIVTRGQQDHVFLLVIPPDAATSAATSALALAASGRNGEGPEKILAGVRSRTDNGDLPLTRPRSARTPSARRPLDRLSSGHQSA